jgi:ketosteroid isomerase-like protein
MLATPVERGVFGVVIYPRCGIGRLESGLEPAHVSVRGIMVWRKEPDGVWRVAMERIG